jgi:hypothetical protein
MKLRIPRTVRFINLLLVIFITVSFGCGTEKISSPSPDPISLVGEWQEKFTVSVHLFIGTPEDMMDVIITKELTSILQFENNSFSIKIENDDGYVEKEYQGEYEISADTLIFHIPNESGELSDHLLHYRFISKDLLRLWSVTYPTGNPDVISIALTGIVWSVGFPYSGLIMPFNYKSQGVFTRH